jgi:hypothetical protein
MKPLGVGLAADPASKTLGFYVSRPTHAEDAIWEAVRTAIDEGMSPERFRMEAAEAWEEALRDDAKAARKTLVG